MVDIPHRSWRVIGPSLEHLCTILPLIAHGCGLGGIRVYRLGEVNGRGSICTTIGKPSCMLDEDIIVHFLVTTLLFGNLSSMLCKEVQ